MSKSAIFMVLFSHNFFFQFSIFDGKKSAGLREKLDWYKFARFLLSPPLCSDILSTQLHDQTILEPQNPAIGISKQHKNP